MPPKKNLKLSAVRLCRISDFAGAFLAAAGGEMRSNYFKYSVQTQIVLDIRCL